MSMPSFFVFVVNLPLYFKSGFTEKSFSFCITENSVLFLCTVEEIIMSDDGGSLNTLLKYRFVKKTIPKMNHSDQQNGLTRGTENEIKQCH